MKSLCLFGHEGVLFCTHQHFLNMPGFLAYCGSKVQGEKCLVEPAENIEELYRLKDIYLYLQICSNVQKPLEVKIIPELLICLITEDNVP